MLKQPQQPGSGGRKASNGTTGPAGVSSSVSGMNSGNRTPAGRNRSSAKPSFQSSPVFEGVYNNARMLHFLTAVVGSTCDIRVKNGSMFEGIFKTLSSRCELAVDAVHKRSEDDSSTSAQPRWEDITDTMIFSPSDLVTMICRDVDLNYATKDTFTDTAISSTRVNGEHKEKVLQRWEGGDSNGESYNLENDASNGWDANEMFRYNEVKYGVTSTYDSSLSMYTVPLERGNSDTYRQREARAARLASEIESSPQYRHRVSLENDDGKSEEEKYSAVVRDGNDRERGRESPRDRDRERGRDSPGANNREGKYIPLPQRQREMNRERAERGSGGPPPHNRLSGGYRSTPPSSSSSSPRPPLPSAAGPQPGASPSERSSPLSGRGGAYTPHHPQGSPSPGPASGPASPYTPASPAGPAATGTSASAAQSPASPPAPHGHTVPHSHSLPHSLSDAGRPVNGVSARTSPKAQRPPQSSRTVRTANSHNQSTATRSPKSATSQDTPYLDTSSVSLPAQKTSGPTPTFMFDVNEILNTSAKERSAESPSSTEDSKSKKAPSVQQRTQIEELRKFGQEFRLQASGGSSSSPSSPAAATPPAVSEVDQPNAAKPSSDASAEAKPQPPASSPSQPQPQPSPAPAEDPAKETAATPGAPTAASTTTPVSDRQSPAVPQPARTPGSEEARSDTGERTEGVADQVKKSTLNPNAKEFNPIKPQMPMTKPNTAPTPPRPTPNAVVLPHPGGQGPLYNAPYLSYVSQIHSVQPPPMFQYSMSTVSQGKYQRTKGSVVAQRSDHGNAAPPMLQAAASAAGAPLVASPYPQSYLQYNPQQYGQQQVIQTMTPYPGQPMYPMLQGGARMIGQGGGPHPQALGPPGGPQFPAQGDGPQGPQQGIYAPQSFSHHSGAVHQPQPSSTPTGNQPPPQHAAPSPGQNAQSGPQPQSLYHSGPLSAPTPPNMPPGHTSPQGSYPIQGYSLHSHQGIQPSYPLGQIAQAHVQGAMAGPHHSGSHGQPQLLMLQPPQQGPGSVPQHPQHGPQQGGHQHFYIGHPQAMQVQTHPASFHPPGN
ncbi:ataxin-2-like protein [Scomber japonicus]|uniref:ataxin-2-like protein n=1 Tax=Scomber japonicus TaxID=13676 RepID=UPI0023066E3D|nr:ataxin-2-like protein [Scomber japonicus]